MIDDEGFVDTYWICDECARRNNWVFPNGGNTIIRGKCGHCKQKEEVFLTPTRDFRKPRNTGFQPDED